MSCLELPANFTSNFPVHVFQPKKSTGSKLANHASEAGGPFLVPYGSQSEIVMDFPLVVFLWDSPLQSAEAFTITFVIYRLCSRRDQSFWRRFSCPRQFLLPWLTHPVICKSESNWGRRLLSYIDLLNPIKWSNQYNLPSMCCNGIKGLFYPSLCLSFSLIVMPAVK